MYFVRSIGFSEECLGLHYGHVHKADLGDGDGKKSEHILARQYYFPKWGTCRESIAGTSSLHVPSIFHDFGIQAGTTSAPGSRMARKSTRERGFWRKYHNFSSHVYSNFFPAFPKRR